MNILHSVALGSVAILAGCGVIDPIACTANFVYGITVEVIDSASQLPLADGATMTLRDGSYVESVTDTFDGLRLSGAGERPGTYAVTVARPNYHTWSAVSPVVVTADQCHVIPVALRAPLQLIP
ncbi:MAG: hypothetical protein O2958_00775 [Gemmatimonadetes bacterium]|nr:hypothetical protein [Gemmatimonadota bacterium]MDA1102668.1 hypothetical protein [Gemmatimonadota bacterium]